MELGKKDLDLDGVLWSHDHIHLLLPFFIPPQPPPLRQPSRSPPPPPPALPQVPRHRPAGLRAQSHQPRSPRRWSEGGLSLSRRPPLHPPPRLNSPRRRRAARFPRLRPHRRPLRPRLLRPRRGQRARGHPGAAHQGALRGEVRERGGVRQQLQPRATAHVPRRRRRGHQRMGSGHPRRRRNPANACWWQTYTEASSGACLWHQRCRLQRRFLSHSSKFHPSLRRRIHRQGMSSCIKELQSALAA